MGDGTILLDTSTLADAAIEIWELLIADLYRGRQYEDCQDSGYTVVNPNPRCFIAITKATACG
jgi:hypothetical protein